MPNGTEHKPGCICKDHSGIVERIKDMEGRIESQGTKIDDMKTRSTVTLTTLVFILVGVVVNLIISWPK